MYNIDSLVKRFKARLVDNGFSQRKGLDEQETFSPIVKLVVVRFVLSLVVVENQHVQQMDISNAFLQGDLHDEIYMKFPPGFQAPTRFFEQGEKLMCRLIKSLCELKQAPKEWNAKLATILINLALFKVIWTIHYLLKRLH